MLERLDRELVGLEPVKSRIREIGDLLLVDRLRRRFGIDLTRPTLRMSFTGSPGAGKYIGQETIEILLQVMENNRDDLVVILAGYKDRMDKAAVRVVARGRGGASRVPPRIVSGRKGPLSRKDLVIIEAEDIRQSRVFEEDDSE